MTARLQPLPVAFWRSASGREPVREWLRALDKGDRTVIGDDLRRLQFGWPTGMPLVRKLVDHVWELRSSLPSRREARVLFAGVAAVKFKKKHIGSSLEDFLDEEGILESSTAKAIKSVIAWQLAEEMKAKRVTKQRLADLMRTSRAQVDRILDPEKGNVTIETLQRAALLLGRRLRLELL
jgi:antitoxin HicB